MVHFDAQGRPDGVQYQNLPIMLLTQVQRQQKTIDALLARLAWLEAHATVASTSASVAKLTGSVGALLNPTQRRSLSLMAASTCGCKLLTLTPGPLCQQRERGDLPFTFSKENYFLPLLLTRASLVVGSAAGGEG